MRSPSPSPGPLLTARAALVVLTALVVGLVAGALGFLAYQDVATAVLVGGGAVGGGLALFHALIATDRDNDCDTGRNTGGPR